MKENKIVIVMAQIVRWIIHFFLMVSRMVQQHREMTKDSSGEDKVEVVGKNFSPRGNQPNLRDPASSLKQPHTASTSTGQSAPQSRDARIRTGRSNLPCIPVVPAVQVKLFLFVAR